MSFVLVVFACLMVITYVPQISLALRDLAYPDAAKNSPAYKPQVKAGGRPGLLTFRGELFTKKQNMVRIE